MPGVGVPLLLQIPLEIKMDKKGILKFAPAILSEIKFVENYQTQNEF